MIGGVHVDTVYPRIRKMGRFLRLFPALEGAVRLRFPCIETGSLIIWASGVRCLLGRRLRARSHAVTRRLARGWFNSPIGQACGRQSPLWGGPFDCGAGRTGGALR